MVFPRHVGNIVGEVVEMNWRCIHLVTHQGELVVVPNIEVGQSNVKNFSRLESHLEHLDFSFPDSNAPNKVKQVMCEVAHTTDGVETDVDPVVRIQEGGKYTITLKIPNFSQVEHVHDAYTTLLWYVARRESDSDGSKVEPKIDIAPLVAVHDELAQTVQPATPQTILLLDIEQETSSVIKFLGPVGLVRQMMMAAIISLFVFVSSALSPSVKQDGGDILSGSGSELFLNLLFFLAAAGLGASFSGLYKANQYITQGTFDPAYSASYWIRFFLGLISGLMMAVLIAEESMAGMELLEDGVVRPLLAIIGGFSADLLYTFLSRMVEALKSLFEGSSRQFVEAKEQEMANKLASQVTRTKLRIQQDLLQMQQEIGENASPELNAQLSELVTKISKQD